ncbi:TPA: hypothetical protein HA251_07035 [Candidatus Woesearchaeota archaeon]|nr:hypothetical protein [Candidatus Woesearchaeota archaeon]
MIANFNNYITQLEQNNEVEHVHGRGKVVDGEQYGPVVDAFVLSSHIGKYLIMAGDAPFASNSCRCPALNADVFRRKEVATATLEILAADAPSHGAKTYAVEEITSEFLNWYAHRLDPINQLAKPTVYRGE